MSGSPRSSRAATRSGRRDRFVGWRRVVGAVPIASLLVATACGGPATTAPPVTPTSPPPTAVARCEVTSPIQREDVQIRIRTDRRTVTATLIDSRTTQDFVSLLPMTLTLEDYAGAEKISVLPRRLTTEGAPAGSAPSVGDIAYYAPWGNVALIYRGGGYANGLVLLGRIDGGVEGLSGPGSVRATIELTG
jgi:hypothetical protein